MVAEAEAVVEARRRLRTAIKLLLIFVSGFGSGFFDGSGFLWDRFWVSTLV